MPLCPLIKQVNNTKKKRVLNVLDDAQDFSVDFINTAYEIAKQEGIKLAIVSESEILEAVPDAERYGIDVEDILYSLHDAGYYDKYVIFGKTVGEIVSEVMDMVDSRHLELAIENGYDFDE